MHRRRLRAAISTRTDALNITCSIINSHSIMHLMLRPQYRRRLRTHTLTHNRASYTTIMSLVTVSPSMHKTALNVNAPIPNIISTIITRSTMLRNRRISQILINTQSIITLRMSLAKLISLSRIVSSIAIAASSTITCRRIITPLTIRHIPQSQSRT